MALSFGCWLVQDLEESLVTLAGVRKPTAAMSAIAMFREQAFRKRSHLHLSVLGYFRTVTFIG